MLNQNDFLLEVRRVICKGVMRAERVHRLPKLRALSPYVNKVEVVLMQDEFG
jgi:hypothetical protein